MSGQRETSVRANAPTTKTPLLPLGRSLSVIHLALELAVQPHGDRRRLGAVVSRDDDVVPRVGRKGEVVVREILPTGLAGAPGKVVAAKASAGQKRDTIESGVG